MLGGELERRSAGRLRGRRPGSGTCAAGQKARAIERAPTATQQRDPQRLEADDLAPDAEGGVAAGLVGDRAVVEGRAGPGRSRARHHSDGHREARTNARTAGPDGRGWRCGRSRPRPPDRRDSGRCGRSGSIGASERGERTWSRSPAASSAPRAAGGASEAGGSRPGAARPGSRWSSTPGRRRCRGRRPSRRRGSRRGVRPAGPGRMRRPSRIREARRWRGRRGPRRRGRRAGRPRSPDQGQIASKGT